MSLNQDWQVSFGKTSEDSITKKMGTFRVNVPNNLDDYYGYRQLSTATCMVPPPTRSISPFINRPENAISCSWKVWEPLLRSR